MFVGDVIAGHGVTAFLQAAESAGCKTANGGHMLEAAQDVIGGLHAAKDRFPDGVRATLQQGDRAGSDHRGQSHGKLKQVSGKRIGKPACP
jgi:hypothetical protein